MKVRGHSLGPLFDNWLVFYDDIRDAPDDGLVGHMCVCGLHDGRALVKALKESPATGLWNLLSNTEPPIYDVGLDWTAPVREMRPRDEEREMEASSESEGSGARSHSLSPTRHLSTRFEEALHGAHPPPLLTSPERSSPFPP